MKSALYLLGAAGALIITSCTQTTLENRRDLYFPQTVNGPYTRMLHSGVPKSEESQPAPVKTQSDYKNVVGR